ncbi:transmembrane protein 120 homolog [Folsomia candida]|uniref:Transmembrane protein 120 n=1 Tax=Folsomia candida TaxID=158441 RepID=A0A226E637_FOLCA|nr:transmembrane protein 120 homolog [Folsomia candida]XP_021955028.1 transmembrane protein 120 homolog [Folsomia candida]XP_021955029.1 transmembrane protein 120 homolog [Folsomia candida]XP_021955031.1 transmembrane protein 120 homolog [Folsomia candida]OXA52810.1 hypothetical protein Fcan01_12761 [Folsomia candida]
MELSQEDIQSSVKDFEDLTEEFKTFSASHKEYMQKLDELNAIQSKCLKELTHQRYRLGIIKSSLKKFSKKPESKEISEEIEKGISRRKIQLYEMEEALPKKNGLYLRIILGNVNVSILNKEDKFKYKDEYEKFKFIVNGIGLLMSLSNIFINSRVLDLIFMFMLVWYYCTLTIRESILKVNGSRIKGWWRAHHFISTVLAGVLLIWPNNSVYYLFRPQFMWFNVYISLVQFLQFRYQRGCLYRLRALGERHNMDITIDGFHSWMWRGLSFLLPFLVGGYVWQLYNAYLLYELSYNPEATWQVPVLGGLFLTVFLGNVITTLMIIPQKLKEKVKLKQRFSQTVSYLRRQNREDSPPRPSEESSKSKNQ